MKVLSSVVIVGARGFLGTELSRYFESLGLRVYKIGRSKDKTLALEVPLGDDFRELVLTVKPEVVINLAALTNVDSCESNPYQAAKDNVSVLQAVVEIRKTTSFRVIQISTDQVYSGRGPHKEDGRLSPVNVYGRTKLEAEGLLDIHNDLVFRTNFLGMSRSIGRKSWTDWLVTSLASEENVKIRANSLFSPIHVSDVCENIGLAIEANLSGVYNLGSSTSTEKVDLARAIACDLKFNPNLISEVKEPFAASGAARALDLRLDSSLYETQMGIQLPDIESVRRRVVIDYT